MILFSAISITIFILLLVYSFILNIGTIILVMKNEGFRTFFILTLTANTIVTMFAISTLISHASHEWKSLFNAITG